MSIRYPFHTISGDDWKLSLKQARARRNAAFELIRTATLRGFEPTIVIIDEEPFSFPQNKNLDETKSSPGLLPMNLKLHSSNTVFRNGGQQSLTFSVVDAEGKDIPGKMVQLLVPADHPILKEPNPDATYNLSLTVVS